MKLLNKILFPALLVASLFSACKKDDKDDGPQRTSHKVVFKAIGSADVTLRNTGYGYDTQITTATGIGGTTWTSAEMNVPASAINANVVMNATATSGTATLKVQIFVDGQLKKEGTGTGSILTASATHVF